jgi:drug/metabolite transporter (DMT)-like permease
MKNKYFLPAIVLIVIALIGFILVPCKAEEAEENIYGIEIDSLITIAASMLAVILFVISLIAYKKDKRGRLFFVTGAFLLFAVKGLLIASDVFFPQKGGWVDPTAHMLDFVILLMFFLGLIKE